MRHCITQEQYESLPEQHKQRYLTWVFGKQSITKGYHVPYRSIQHLIMFIDDHIEEGWWNIEREGSKAGWRVQSKYIDFDENDEAELIDALWNAVKVLLGEDDDSDERTI